MRFGAYDEFIDGFSRDIDDKYIYKLKENGYKTNTPVVELNVGRILYFLIKIFKPKKILDVGLGGGLSCYYMAKAACGYGGKVDSVDINNYRISDFAEFLEKNKLSKIRETVNLIHQDASEYLSESKKKYSMVFIDAVKKEYWNYFRAVKPKISENSIVVFDNFFYNGRALYLADYPENVSKYGIQAGLLKDFINRIQAESGFEKLLLSESDGVLILRKNSKLRSDK
jgi:caffeoyl-CoA O-methyltransferase